MQNEIWKDIDWQVGRYQISNLGRIKSLARKGNDFQETILKTRLSYKGYVVTTITYNGKNKPVVIHRLVGKAFIPNPNNLPQINHINGIKTDNRVENLEWCNNSYNQLEANRMGFCKNRVEKSILGRSKPIAQYDLNGNFIKEYFNARIADKETGISYKTISLAANKKTKTAGGYVWKFTEKTAKKIDIFVSGKESAIDRKVVYVK